LKKRVWRRGSKNFQQSKHFRGAIANLDDVIRWRDR